MISTTVDEETGEERKRLINRMRWKGYGPASIMFADVHVPPFSSRWNVEVLIFT
jgi:general transcription factor 3C polypeptide 5 (transcription factor C subunit 1)